MKKIILLFFISILVISNTKVYSQDNIDSIKIKGIYKELTCFRSSECVIEKLKLKRNNKYSKKYFANNHGKKNRIKYTGNWKLKGDILTLIPKKTKNKKELTLSFKYYEGNLWVYSKETLEVDYIYLKSEENYKQE